MENRKVMVTGATGYVALYVVKELLERGFTVHATVRNPDKGERTQALRSLGETFPKEKLILFKADLLDPASFEAPMQGCEIVIHTASPFIQKVKDPQNDLIKPALEGTRNVLETVNKVSSVKRVVLTSSVAAILGDGADVEFTKEGIFTEEYWNKTSDINHQPYSYSKKLAEEEAWKINREQNRWDLVVINPSLVIGPGISPHATSESFNLIRQLGDGSMKSGLPDFCIGVVDVRDVAKAHVEAAVRPEAEGRHIVSATEKTFMEMTQVLRGKYGDRFAFPSRVLPKWLVWLVAPLAGFKRKMISRNVGHPWKLDNSKSISALGLTYRSFDTSLIEMFQQMIDSGLVKPRK